MSDAAIVRSVPFEITRADGESSGLTLEGYAAVYDIPIRVDNPWEGRFDEKISRTAFDKSIHDRTQWPVMMFEHGRHAVIGRMPIGVITHMRSDAKGLFVRAKLVDNWLTSPVRDAVAARAVRGMSFRAEPVQESTDSSTDPPTVTRTELRLIELGPVVEPAYEQTTVTVRSKAIAEALADPEQRHDLAVALLSPVERGAIGAHSTGTVDKPWDGPGATANASNDAAVLRHMHAWVSPDGDPKDKSSYKFPHHAPGTNSPANLAGVRNALARLPQADIPAGDRAAVERHLRRHLKDGGGEQEEPKRSTQYVEPPEGHSLNHDGPPEGHPEPPEHEPTPDAVMRAQLRRVDAIVGIAERSTRHE